MTLRNVISLLSMLGVLAGCALPQAAPPPFPAAYQPRNVFQLGSALPPAIRRVAVLPMSCDPNDPQMLAGRETLEPVLWAELGKTHRFETVAISPELLQHRTGRPQWSCEEALPGNLFPWLADTRDCDAVLFCRLTVFRAYAPLAVGWRMRLVDLRTHATVWAGDETLDASQAPVPAVTWRTLLAQLPGYPAAPDTWAAENSPRQFGQLAAERLLATLPSR